MPERPDPTAALFQAVRDYVTRYFAGELVDYLEIHLTHPGRKPIVLPLTSVILPGPGAPAAFDPSPFQLGVLDALAGKALRVDRLAEVVKDRPRLYRDPGGLKELERQGLVAHSKKLGYYRPDAPPEELEGEAS